MNAPKRNPIPPYPIASIIDAPESSMIIRIRMYPYLYFFKLNLVTNVLFPTPSECTSPDIRLVSLLPAPSLYSWFLRRNVWFMVARNRAKIWFGGSIGRFSPARHHGALPAFGTKDCSRARCSLHLITVVGLFSHIKYNSDNSNNYYTDNNSN